MDRQERIATIGIACSVAGIIFAVYLAFRVGAITVSQIEGYIVEGVIVGGGITLISLFAIWGFRPRLRRWAAKSGVVEEPPQAPVSLPSPVAGVTQADARPLIDVVPLPHKKGHLRMPLSRSRIAGSKYLDPSRTDQRFTNREARDAAGSQRWDGGLGKFRISSTTRWADVSPDEWVFWAKFGVVRVQVSRYALQGARAQSWFMTLVDPSGSSEEGQWISSGDLDWYNEASRTDFLRHRRVLRSIKRDPSQGINQYLGRDRATSIVSGDYRDLQLFYTLNDDSRVFACGGSVSRSVGAFTRTKKVKFKVRVRILASNFEPKEWLFEASAKEDDFEMVRVG